MTVAIIDYGSGNLHSAAKAFERAAMRGRNRARILSPQIRTRSAVPSAIVLPGVGAYADCLSGLMPVEGMLEALEESVTRDGKPFLGICVGMQLLSERGLNIASSRPRLDQRRSADDRAARTQR